MRVFVQGSPSVTAPQRDSVILAEPPNYTLTTPYFRKPTPRPVGQVAGLLMHA